MKVNVYETIEISDEQRVQLGAILDGRVKPKRQATRDEIKSFVWDRGSSWAEDLADDYRHDFEDADADVVDADEDLLGMDDEDLI